MRSRTSSSVFIEPLELRRLLTWSSYAQLVGQDTAASDFPNLKGDGVTIAMIDTGIDYTQAALGGGFGPGYKVIAGYDFYDNDSDPMDESGHGTNTASVVAANPYTVNGITYQGVAPDANLVALRVGTDTDIPDANLDKALKWVIQNYKTYGIDIVSISLGSGNYTSPETEQPLSADFQTLKNLGIFVVAASGNSNDQQSGPIAQEGIAFPAADPNVFAVGAVDSNDVITTWSQRGSELDLLAPGVNIVMPAMGGGYVTEDGTSFAAPYVAGTAALIKEEDPSATPGDIGSILMSSGMDNRDGDVETGNTTGLLFSRLDIDSALKMAKVRIGKATSLPASSAFSTALDSDGVLHAAYYDPRHHDLLYATRDTSGKWSAAKVIDSSADVGSQLSIAVDSTGKVGIAYYDATNQDLKYASFNGKSWTIQAVDTYKSVGQSPSLAFDQLGDAYIGYYDKSHGNLKLATLDRDAGKWTTTTVDGSSDNVGADVSLSVGQVPVSNGFFISYDRTVALAYSDSTNGDLKYARLDIDDPSATWYMATAAKASGVNNIDLALHAGPANLGLQGAVQAQIAYHDVAANQIKYAYRNNTWFTETAASGKTIGSSVQMSFDSSNDPMISYYNSQNRSVYTATRATSTKWSQTRIASSGVSISDALNERTDDSILTWLGQASPSLYSKLMV